MITKKGSDDFRLFDEELPDLSIFDRNLFSRKENYDEEALRKRIRTLWNECVKQEGFNIQPYIQESRRLEQQYVTELTSFEILQYKTWLEKIEAHEATLRDVDKYKEFNTSGDYVDGFHIGAASTKFTSPESIEAERGRMKEMKQALELEMEELQAVRARTQILEAPTHAGSDYISMWSADVIQSAFGKPHRVHVALKKNLELVNHIKSANLAAVRMLDEMCATLGGRAAEKGTTRDLDNVVVG